MFALQARERQRKGEVSGSDAGATHSCMAPVRAQGKPPSPHTDAAKATQPAPDWDQVVPENSLRKVVSSWVRQRKNLWRIDGEVLEGSQMPFISAARSALTDYAEQEHGLDDV